jgi:DDE superfamily endonuclease
VFQPLDQGITQNWKCYVKKQLLQFLVTEFDSGRDYSKTHHVLQAIKWGIEAWHLVETSTIINCWAKGFENQANKDPWSDSNQLIKRIQATASVVARNEGIRELIDIRRIIHNNEEQVVDSEEGITEQIIAYYSLPEGEEAESSKVIEDEAPKVLISEAIAGLRALKLYQEQKAGLVNQVLMAQLRKELQELEAERNNSYKQADLTDWLQ